ncbi:hypothetical protein [Algicola sagamiensis]|uniref:hypothetical protein n=1 Tax=Algicola sagamiensis TaxID=163869 RepID=UPI0003A9892E|nr:hypothetical protein [Algicola sagamiensis]
MSIELNKFIQHAQHDKVSLQSNQQGDPVLSSGGSLKGKVVKMLSVVGLDKNQFVENYKAQNYKVTYKQLAHFYMHFKSTMALILHRRLVAIWTYLGPLHSVAA